jgi:hypothetical protein
LRGEVMLDLRYGALVVQTGHMFSTVDSVTRRDGRALRPPVLERVET